MSGVPGSHADPPQRFAAGRLVREAHVELAVAGCLLVLGAYVLLWNWFDWDLFLSFNEVDRRSWVLDLRPPLWSYQLCAGVTRIGDPQAFGLSPLFLLIVLFGPFWGSKLAVLATAAIGLYFTMRLLALFASREAGAPIPRAAVLTLASLFITSNFFLWHLVVGHFWIVSFAFGLGIIFYTLEGYLRGLGWKPFAVGALIAWQHYSGGFFHSTVYLLTPFFIAFGLFAAVTAAFGLKAGPALRSRRWRGLVGAAGFHACGLLLASYKLLAVWQQQQLYPRVLPPANEANTLGELLVYQLLPTFGTGWPVPLDTSGHWDLHEYSAFSLLPIVALALAARSVSLRRRAPARAADGAPTRHPLTLFVALYAALSIALVLGTFSDFAPFALLNAKLFQNTIRCVGRYGVGVTLSLALVCALLLRRLGPTGLGTRACLGLLLLSLLNLTTFSWLLSVPQTLRMATFAYDGKREMTQQLEISEPAVKFGREMETPSTTDMYATLRSGAGVINCYNELPHTSIGGWSRGFVHELIDDRFGSPSRDCIEQSYYTQNTLEISGSCPDQVCLNVADLNPCDPPAHVRYHPGRQRFCRTVER